MSFFKWKDKPENQNLGVKFEEQHSSQDKHLKTLTEDLYKRNVELALKNKTLELLRKLYQISILALEPAALAERIAKTILEPLNFELVGIFTFEKNSDEIKLLGYKASDRVVRAATQAGYSFNFVTVPGAYRKEFFKPLIGEQALIFREGIADLWSVAPESLPHFEEESHIKTTLLFPLAIETDLLGILSISLNRSFNDLIEFEKESITSFAAVTAVALDRASLYQALHVTNEQLENANGKLKKLDQLKSEFMSLATHQIRSPLTAIKGYASLILEGDYGVVGDSLKEVVQIIYNSCEHLVTIVGEFLDVSRIEQGSMKYNKTDFDFRELVLETIDQLKPIIKHASLDFTFADDEKQVYPVNADRIKVKEVISNLIDNSIKYTPHGVIAVILNRNENDITLSIKDTGVGIDPEELPKLFEKFVRAKDANKVNVSGTGLGLYIAKQIIEAHGGKLKAFSEGKGRGSTFVIELEAKG